MIFVTDKGRLANNIFQYGQLYAWGRAHHRTTMSMRFAHKYPDFKIAHTAYHHHAVYLLAKLAARLHLIPTVEFTSLKDSYEAQQHTMLTRRHVLATGWCVRFPDLFERYKADIIRLFDFMPRVHQKVDAVLAPPSEGGMRLGVHIRRGDYKTWCGGIYYFSDQQYVDAIRQTMALHPGKHFDLYICSNDPALQQSFFRSQLPAATVHFPCGTAAEDLCLLSRCDCLIGPPSTYTLIASMYRDVPLCWLDGSGSPLSAESFRCFDYQARHFDDYYRHYTV